MVLIVDKVLQGSISVQRLAGQPKLFPSGSLLSSRSTQCRVSQNIGVVYSAQSDVQKKKLLTTRKFGAINSAQSDAQKKEPLTTRNIADVFSAQSNVQKKKLLTTRKVGAINSAQSDAQTKEPLTTRNIADVFSAQSNVQKKKLLTTRKVGAINSAQSDAQTKEPLTTRNIADAFSAQSNVQKKTLLTTRKVGAINSAQSDAQTKEPLTTRNIADVYSAQSNVQKIASRGDNGSSSHKPPTQLFTLDSSNAIASDPVRLQASLTIRKQRRLFDDEQRVEMVDALADRLGQKITLQLVSVEVDLDTGLQRRKVSDIEDWFEKMSVVADKVQYTAKFSVEKDFGIPGALIITNKHQCEFFLESVSLFGHPMGTVHFPTHAWVHSEHNNPAPRVFFSNRVYLPSSTPKGLQQLREEGLNACRGDGQGERKVWENVYDYDVYNDLDDVDRDNTLARPVLGGSEEFKYPRRNRSGRRPMQIDSSKESRAPPQDNPYIPRDDAFEPIKQESYYSAQLKAVVQIQTMPGLRESFTGFPADEFDRFEDIDRLYSEGVTVMKKREETVEDGGNPLVKVVDVALSGLVKTVEDVVDTMRGLPVFAMLPSPAKQSAVAATEQPVISLRYPCPNIIATDRFAWMRDDEFARQALAGMNPCAIELLKVFPPVSALENVDLYGPRESDIKRHHIESRLGGMSIEEALQEEKLFILDYHDIFIPYIHRINALEGRKGYASRTLFFLTEMGTLTPLVIELSLPPRDLSGSPSRKVFVPSNSPTQHWLWQLAKAHVSCNDAGHHQLVSHWLRTHACVEPYVIATNRQLSPLHPIFKLLHPHFRYTLEINAAARQRLISSDGVIEQSFLAGKYSVEMSSAVYGEKWRFDKEALPEELISRGLAKEDQTSEIGVKLLIEDYPFANDGLLVWSAIESWVTDYVSIYYKNRESIQQDEELQKWWEDIRIHGHADKKDEEWWPLLETKQDLIRILTTMMWVTSGLHAAVNFGQYDYAGYVPNKPTLLRRHIPQPDTPEYTEFLANPQLFFLKSLPSQKQSIVFMAVIDTLSNHSPDEEYLGSDTHPNWFGCPEAVAAYKRFQKKMIEVDGEIQRRNGDSQLRNRNGAVLPYELLLPWSKPGVTCQGIPNSISI